MPTLRIWDAGARQRGSKAVDDKLSAHAARRNRNIDGKRWRRPFPSVGQKYRGMTAKAGDPGFTGSAIPTYEAGFAAGLDSGALVSVLDFSGSEVALGCRDL